MPSGSRFTHYEQGAGAQKVGHMTGRQGFQVVGRAGWPMAISEGDAGAPPPRPSTVLLMQALNGK